VATGDLRNYTLAAAGLLGIELDDDEIDPVTAQVERVAGLVDRLPRVEDDAATMAPRFRP
jgi:hypothetical protein